MTTLKVSSLAPELLDHYLSFFDQDAFVDNPDWAGCYCQFYLIDHRNVDWDSLPAAQNRQSAIERIAAGKMQGYLAYSDGKAVGWCRAAPRESFPAFQIVRKAFQKSVPG